MIEPAAARVLRLADGLGWQFLADETGREWLDAFADRMELPADGTGNGSLSRVFVGSRPLDGSPASSWQPARRLGALAVRWRKGDTTLWYQPPARSSVPRNTWFYSQWYALYPLYPGLLRRGHLPLHAGMAVRNGRALLVSAPGGTGKSTTLRRLPPSWQPLGDDETWLIRRSDGSLVAHTMPTWSDLILRGRDQTWSQPPAWPVEAIVFLRQAGEDSLKPVRASHATPLLNQAAEQMFRRAWGVLSPPDLEAVRRRVFEVAADTSVHLSSWELELTLDGSFWTLLDDAGLCR